MAWSNVRQGKFPRTWRSPYGADHCRYALQTKLTALSEHDIQPPVTSRDALHAGMHLDPVLVETTLEVMADGRRKPACNSELRL